jgi:hypothetical protein
MTYCACVVGYFASLFIRGLFIDDGHAVAQLGETLRYKPEGRGFDSDEVIGFFN